MKNLIEWLKNYLKESKIEIQRVSWPTRQEVYRYLVIIIAFSLLMAVFLGAFDFGFLKLIETIILN